MSVPSHFAPYKGFLQIAYVTTDFDRALSEFAAQYGVPTWLQLRNLEIETGKDRSCRAHVALAYVGATQLEVIQALGGDDTVYRHGLPEQGYAVRLNHLAQLIDTEAEFEAIHDGHVYVEQANVGLKLLCQANGLFGRAALAHDRDIRLGGER